MFGRFVGEEYFKLFLNPFITESVACNLPVKVIIQLEKTIFVNIFNYQIKEYLIGYHLIKIIKHVFIKTIQINLGGLYISMSHSFTNN